MVVLTIMLRNLINICVLVMLLLQGVAQASVERSGLASPSCCRRLPLVDRESPRPHECQRDGNDEIDRLQLERIASALRKLE